ncbi:hypothetical protein [Ruminococcus sp.]|uniref:hypothetical protein n=1 Tax=Ruminococcus sp. TaxID=41978 RepID=UPI00262C9FD2|nr:hypothetical protein [Ruminococcus sp.]MDD6988764.1 hypothetical protein [Ruminococcus sp.]
MQTVNILGTEYKVVYKDFNAEPSFEERGIDGYCDSIDKVICVCNMKTYPCWEKETEQYCEKQEKITLRHEIIHAFLNESGLQDNSVFLGNVGWAKNEEMIDFFAIQSPKIYKVYEELGII